MNTYEFVEVCECEKCAGAELAHDSFVLYVCAATYSIGTGNPGFVPDSFLATFPGDTTTSAIELRVEKRWLRRPGGYQIVHNPLVEAVLTARDRVDRDIVLCRHAGSHTPDADDPECCGVCGIWMDDDLKRRL